jgi:hypothetical protein
MRYILLAIALFFAGCSTTTYTKTQSKILIIKTKKFKFSDLAYIRNNGNSIQIEMFVAGKVIKRIEIQNFICVDEGCISKSSFNKEYLSKYYPDSFLQNIFQAKKIFKGKNTTLTPNGFTQNIKTKNVDIKYSVTPKQTYFKDKKNKILIKIKEISNG